MAGDEGDKLARATVADLELRERVRAWIEEGYGPRCDEFDSECFLCHLWEAWDQLFGHLNE